MTYNYYSDGQNPTSCCDSGEYYYFYDALGNVNGVLDDGGHYYRWEMDAFGNDLPSGNSFLDMDQPGPKEHLTGKMFETATGLYYFAARWYDPQVGRFVSRDPSWTVEGEYVLARSNPHSYIDPGGNCDIAIDPQKASPKGHEPPSSAKDCACLPEMHPSIMCCKTGGLDLWDKWLDNKCVLDLLKTNKDTHPPDAYRQCKGPRANRVAGACNCDSGGCTVWYVPSGDLCLDKCRCALEETAVDCVLKKGTVTECEIKGLNEWFDCVEKYFDFRPF